jgi:hypothetical protein
MEYRVWQRGSWDWCWQAREDNWSTPCASGTETSRPKAIAAAKAKIAELEARSAAKWKRVV